MPKKEIIIDKGLLDNAIHELNDRLHELYPQADNFIQEKARIEGLLLVYKAILLQSRPYVPQSNNSTEYR